MSKKFNPIVPPFDDRGDEDRLTSAGSTAGKTLVFTHNGTDATLTNGTGKLNFTNTTSGKGFVWNISGTVPTTTNVYEFHIPYIGSSFYLYDAPIYFRHEGGYPTIQTSTIRMDNRIYFALTGNSYYIEPARIVTAIQYAFQSAQGGFYFQSSYVGGSNVFDFRGVNSTSAFFISSDVNGNMDGSQVYIGGTGSGAYVEIRAASVQIGKNGGKIGFYGITTVARPSAYTQTYSTATRTHSNLTASTVSTTASTNVSPYGYTTSTQADAIVTQINNLLTDVTNVKQVLNQVIDDLQLNGLLQ